ncbi:MAG: ferredoxin family protein, partial [Crenarchaeota archaeon]|nr:ferredoxin family protein [Thermoproteota archaeon]
MKLWRKPFDHNEKTVAPVKINIDRERCKGCRYCVEFCPRKVLSMSSEIGPKGYNPAMVSDESKCLACGFCEAICPEFAIKLSSNSGTAADTEDAVQAAKQ